MASEGEEFLNNDEDDQSSKLKLYIGQVVEFCIICERITTLCSQIPPGIEEKELIQLFSEFGEVLEFRFIRDKTNMTYKGNFFPNQRDIP